MSSCPRTALLLTSCARAMAAGTPSCSASVLGGMMCHGRRPLKLLPVHAGPPSRLVFFPVPRRTHPVLLVSGSGALCPPVSLSFGSLALSSQWNNSRAKRKAAWASREGKAAGDCRPA